MTFGGGKIKIKGQGHEIINHAFRMKGCIISVSGSNNHIEIEKDVRMKNVNISITGNGHKLKICKGVRFVHGGGIRLEDMSNSIIIGENTTIYDAFLSAGDKNTKIEIGNDNLFSVNVILRTSDSHSILSENGNVRINMGENIILGDHVWLCNGVNVLKGVSIGSGSVIGTQSVVTKDVPSKSIACGNPAKVVKTNIRWNEQRFY